MLGGEIRSMPICSPTNTPPSVSIITPAFNEAGCFAEALASVRAQTVTDWEWIVADNASTDATVALVEAAMRDDARIRLIRVEGPSGSAARARNAALAAARGCYLAFLDADDLWLPRKLEKQLALLEADPTFDGVCTWYDLFGDPERLRSDVRVMRPGGLISRRELLQGGAVLTSTFMIRRCVYDEIGGMDEDPRLKSGQDAEYFARILARYRLYRLPEVLVRYRLLPASASLSYGQWDLQNRRGWTLLEILTEKGVLTPEEVRARRGFLHYEQARNSFFWAGGPFRGALWKSLATGRPPARAVIMLALSFLPGFLLRPLLILLQKGLSAVRS